MEFSTPEMAEDVQRLTDGRSVAGTHIRVSFCAPGPPGRSMLAALIAAQTMVDPHTSLLGGKKSFTNENIAPPLIY